MSDSYAGCVLLVIETAWLAQGPMEKVGKRMNRERGREPERDLCPSGRFAFLLGEEFIWREWSACAFRRIFTVFAKSDEEVRE